MINVHYLAEQKWFMVRRIFMISNTRLEEDFYDVL
jgi:hypothetical protein